MVEIKQGLGRGLTSLLGENLSEVSSNNNKQLTIPIEKLKPGPWQARKTFNSADLEDLTNSIVSKGIISPILVTPVKVKSAVDFYIIAGERRWRAAQLAKIHEVPVIILKDLGDVDASIISLIENIQRKDLNPIEEAKGFSDLIDKYNYTQESAAKVVGKSRVYITNSLRLLKLPKKVIMLLEDGTISAGHARLLIGKDNALELALRVIKNNISVRELEKLINNKKPKIIKQKKEDINLTASLKIISDTLGIKVNIDYKDGNEKSKVIFHCNNLGQLNNLINRLENIPNGK
ncbi:MAG: chromosome partitioning protein ParB [SAR116 cluster bacterium]|nr:chromosome partitioning protein ParB [SAR116 cluster bacterium]